MTLIEHIASCVNAFNIMKKPVDWQEIHAQIRNFSGSHRELKALYEKFYFPELDHVVLIYGISGLEITENQVVCHIKLVGFSGLHLVGVESVPIDIFREFLDEYPHTRVYICNLCSEEYLSLLRDRFGSDVGLVKEIPPYAANYKAKADAEEVSVSRKEYAILEPVDSDRNEGFEKRERYTDSTSESDSKSSCARKEEPSLPNVRADYESSNPAPNAQYTSESAVEQPIPLVFTDMASAYSKFPECRDVLGIMPQALDASAERHARFLVLQHMNNAKTMNRVFFYFDSGFGFKVDLADLPSLPHLQAVYNAAVAYHLLEHQSEKLSFGEGRVTMMGESVQLDELQNSPSWQITFNFLTFFYLVQPCRE